MYTLCTRYITKFLGRHRFNVLEHIWDHNRWAWTLEEVRICGEGSPLRLLCRSILLVEVIVIFQIRQFSASSHFGLELFSPELVLVLLSFSYLSFKIEEMRMLDERAIWGSL